MNRFIDTSRQMMGVWHLLGEGVAGCLLITWPTLICGRLYVALVIFLSVCTLLRGWIGWQARSMRRRQWRLSLLLLLLLLHLIFFKKWLLPLTPLFLIALLLLAVLRNILTAQRLLPGWQGILAIVSALISLCSAATALAFILGFGVGGVAGAAYALAISFFLTAWTELFLCFAYSHR